MTSSMDARSRIPGLARQLVLAVLLFVGLWYGLRSVYPVVLFFVPYAGVGTFLVLRGPRNVIGWILIGLAWFFVLIETSGLDHAALQARSANVLQEALAWAHAWIGSAFTGLLFVLTVVFPSGRLPEGGWGRLARWALVIVAVFIVVSAFQPTAFTVAGAEGSIDIPNPLALFPEASFWAISRGGQLVSPLFFLMFAGVISILIRYRRSRGLERQQLRWVVSALAFLAVSIVVGFVTIALGGPAAESVGWIPALMALLMVPISIGIAVMRYRLYEIDRIISRTLAYAVLTASLAVVYVAGFVGLQALATPFTDRVGPVAVAASTLGVAALFQPLRRRIQHAVDRRFHRARYDAEATATAFARVIRDEVDLTAVESALLVTVESVVRPQVASLWLRGGDR